MVHYAEHRSFEYLSFDERTLYDDDRLVRKGDFTLAHCIDITCELHRREVASIFGILFSREELLEECRIHISEILHHLHHFISSADNSPVIVLGCLSVEKIEYGLFVLHSAVVK